MRIAIRRARLASESEPVKGEAERPPGGFHDDRRAESPRF
jgi:hypothetical protein